MKITETKYQNIKIIYNPAIENIKIGDFIKFTKEENSLIGQVSKISSSCVDDDFNTAELTFVLTQKYNTIKPWKGENLPINARCELLNEDYLTAMFPFDLNERLLNFGSFLQFEAKSTDLPYKKFKTPAYVGYDRVQDCEKLLQMFAYNFDSLNEKLVILDFKGTIQIPGAHRILAGEELKLPFNDFILSEVGQKLVEGLSTDCKVVVEDVLQELAAYSKENKYNFVPINSLISVVDEMYKTYRLNPLMMFKNKLARFEKNNIFANQPREVLAIYNAMKAHNVIIVDFSYIPIEWHKEFVSNILQMNKREKASFYLYLTLDEQNSDNKILNKLLFKTLSNGIKPILASNYRYISFENIYEFSQNVFLFKIRTPFTRKQDLYEITQALPDESFVINGTLTDGLILCSTLGQYEEKIFVQKSRPIYEQPEEDTTLNILNNALSSQNKAEPVKNVGAMELQNAMKNPNFHAIENPTSNINNEILNESFKIQEPPANEIKQNMSQVQQNTVQETAQDIIEEKDESKTEPQLIIQPEPQATIQPEPQVIVQPEPQATIQPEQQSEPTYQAEQISQPSIPVERQMIINPEIGFIQQPTPQPESVIQVQQESLSQTQQIQDEILPQNEESQLQPIENNPEEILPQKDIQNQDNSLNELDIINSLQEDFSEPLEEIESVDDIENIDDIENSDSIENINTTEEIDNSTSLDNDFNSIIENTNNFDSVSSNDVQQPPIVNLLNDLAEDNQNNDNEDDMDEELLDLLNETETQQEESLEDFLEEVENLDNTEEEPIEENQDTEEKPIPQGKASIPVYDTNYNTTTNTGINLAEGDMVKHKKYGVGVVKKLIPHQDKFLCSISFDAGFRRLLDPEVSDLEKIS